MTPEEREKILDVICTADRGACARCVHDLLDRLRMVLPDEPWPKEFTRDEMWARHRKVEEPFQALLESKP